MSKAAADFVAAQIIMKPNCHMGLTAGNTPLKMFDELVKLYKEHHVSYKNTTFYNLEEMADVPADDPSSLRVKYFNQLFLDHVDAATEQLVLPEGFVYGPEEACKKYDELMDNLPDGRLDMQVLGIGENAHIGLNMPNENLSGPAHIVINRVGRPLCAMGLHHIWLAKKILLIANGEAKADAIAKMINGPITTQAPASLLQLHPDVTVMLDKPAASLL